MKKRLYTCSALLLCSLLAGCTYGCFAAHGPGVEELLHPKPYLDNWQKPGVMAEVWNAIAIFLKAAK